jgi:hypothetical protein
MTKSPKQLSNCLQRAETSVVLIVFNGGLYHIHVYTVTFSYYHYTRISKAIFPSVTVCNSKIFSQCILTGQIEPMQDKNEYINSFRYNAAQIWNELPNHFRQETSLEHLNFFNSNMERQLMPVQWMHMTFKFLYLNFHAFFYIFIYFSFLV